MRSCRRGNRRFGFGLRGRRHSSKILLLNDLRVLGRMLFTSFALFTVILAPLDGALSAILNRRRRHSSNTTKSDIGGFKAT